MPQSVDMSVVQGLSEEDVVIRPDGTVFCPFRLGIVIDPLISTIGNISVFIDEVTIVITVLYISAKILLVCDSVGV